MPNIPKIEQFFPSISSFAHASIFNNLTYPWFAIGNIPKYIKSELAGKSSTQLPSQLLVEQGDEPHLYCNSSIRLQETLIITELSIIIGKNTLIEKTALIKPYTTIGQNCEVRHGAYIRGGVIAGDHCTLGHTTEIKNAIIMNHSEMGHFNYIGDSIIGSYVNIGAGTKLANLKFRKAEDKIAVAFPPLLFLLNGKRVDSGVAKLGSIIGDQCELGCNSVLSPASMLLPEVWVYPNSTISSGLYGPKKMLAPPDLKVKVRPLPK